MVEMDRDVPTREMEKARIAGEVVLKVAPYPPALAVNREAIGRNVRASEAIVCGDGDLVRRRR